MSRLPGPLVDRLLNSIEFFEVVRVCLAVCGSAL